jgi:hypothetical protein
MVDARELVRSLKRQESRCRTGVLSLPTSVLGTESKIAVALDIEFLDYRERLKALVPPHSKYLNLTLTRLVEDLDDIANAKTGEICVLIANFDIAFARLRTEEIRRLWETLLTDFPHKTRALLLCVPAHADGSFSFPDSGIRTKWRESDRFAEWDQT